MKKRYPQKKNVIAPFSARKSVHRRWWYSTILGGAIILAGMTTANAETCPGNVCNLKVHGVVTATSCDVDDNSRHQTVNLGNVSIGAFKNVGDVSNPETFRIKLIDCSDNITGGTITFQGTPDVNNSDLLQLTPGSGVATGVGVQIMDGNGGSPIPLGKPVGTSPLSAGNNELVYSLRYKSTQPQVTAGIANAVMYFDLSYQ